jgi:hypothetical protein
VADELALHAEHAHAVVATVGDCDVTVPGHEAQSTRVLQLTVAAAFRSEATKKSAVAPLERTNPMDSLWHHDDVTIGAHANRTAELTHANEAMEVEARRQHMHAVVAVLRHEHEVVGCYPHLAWILELQRPVAPASDDPQPRAVSDTERVDCVRAAGVV